VLDDDPGGLEEDPLAERVADRAGSLDESLKRLLLEKRRWAGAWREETRAEPGNSDLHITFVDRPVFGCILRCPAGPCTGKQTAGRSGRTLTVDISQHGSNGNRHTRVETSNI
jgi:hypothetical protein